MLLLGRVGDMGMGLWWNIGCFALIALILETCCIAFKYRRCFAYKWRLIGFCQRLKNLLQHAGIGIYTILTYVVVLYMYVVLFALVDTLIPFRFRYCVSPLCCFTDDEKRSVVFRVDNIIYLFS